MALYFRALFARPCRVESDDALSASQATSHRALPRASGTVATVLPHTKRAYIVRVRSVLWSNFSCGVIIDVIPKRRMRISYYKAKFEVPFCQRNLCNWNFQVSVCNSFPTSITCFVNLISMCLVSATHTREVWLV